MKKIPTVFKRDPNNMKHVLPEVTPGCEWVLAGEGTATRKFDGTCIGIGIREGWPRGVYVRREVKPGKEPPSGFQMVQYDEATGKTVGWEPLQQSGYARYIEEALKLAGDLQPGTYELVGPKVNGNPERFERHVLISHDRDTTIEPLDQPPRDFDGLKSWLLLHEYEGIVWHHEDGRMAKLKRRDF